MRNPNSRFVIVTNRYASALRTERGASRLESQIIEPLRRFGNKIIQLAMPSANELSDNLEMGDTVVSCGGDGTVNWLMNTLHNHQAAKHVTIVPQPFGGANDIAEGLYGNTRLEDIVKNGTPRTAYAITASIEQLHSSDVQRIHALGYIGVGASGAAAMAINSDRLHMQKHRVVSRAARAILRSQRFYHVDDTNQAHPGFEWLALNGRMSYVIKPRRDYYFENAHQQVFAHNKTLAFAQIGLSIGRLVRGGVLADEATASLQPLQQVCLQADGESYTVSPYSRITIHNGPAITLAKL